MKALVPAATPNPTPISAKLMTKFPQLKYRDHCIFLILRVVEVTTSRIFDPMRLILFFIDINPPFKTEKILKKGLYQLVNMHQFLAKLLQKIQE